MSNSDCYFNISKMDRLSLALPLRIEARVLEVITSQDDKNKQKS